MGDESVDLSPQSPQPAEQDRRSREAIGIVVTMDSDPLSSFEGEEQAPSSLIKGRKVGGL